MHKGLIRPLRLGRSGQAEFFLADWIRRNDIKPHWLKRSTRPLRLGKRAAKSARDPGGPLYRVRWAWDKSHKRYTKILKSLFPFVYLGMNS